MAERLSTNALTLSGCQFAVLWNKRFGLNDPKVPSTFMVLWTLKSFSVFFFFPSFSFSFSVLKLHFMPSWILKIQFSRRHVGSHRDSSGTQPCQQPVLTLDWLLIDLWLPEVKKTRDLIQRLKQQLVNIWGERKCISLRARHSVLEELTLRPNTVSHKVVLVGNNLPADTGNFFFF